MTFPLLEFARLVLGWYAVLLVYIFYCGDRKAEVCRLRPGHAPFGGGRGGAPRAYNKGEQDKMSENYWEWRHQSSDGWPGPRFSLYRTASGGGRQRRWIEGQLNMDSNCKGNQQCYGHSLVLGKHRWALATGCWKPDFMISFVWSSRIISIVFSRVTWCKWMNGGNTSFQRYPLIVKRVSAPFHTKSQDLA